MRRIISIILVIALFATMLVGFSVVSNAEEQETVKDYVTFIAKGSDPYASFTFANGAVINPDTAKYIKIKYRSTAGANITGTRYVGQFYVTPAKEPSVPIEYNFSGNWETIVVDCTKLFENATTESLWNSESYTNGSRIRYDMLESLERVLNKEEAEILIKAGDSIDVAWLAVFENQQDAENYTGTETTPVAIVDVDSMENPVSMSNCTKKVVRNGEVDNTVIDTSKTVELYSGKIATGYWFHNAEMGSEGNVYFTSDVWFNGISFFSFCSENNVHMLIEVYRGTKEIYSGEFTTSSNNFKDINLGTKCQPGDYSVTFIVDDNSEYTDWWFVLGSANLPENNDTYCVTVEGSWNTNENTLPGAAVALYECEPGEVETPSPTAEVTKAPEATTKPTEAPVVTAEPTAEPKASGCNSVISGGVAIIAVLATTLIVKRKED